MFKRSKRRYQERNDAAKARMRGLMSMRSYEWAQPEEVDKQVRSRTDAPSRSAARKEHETPSAS